MLFALLGKYDPTLMTANVTREREVMEDPPEGIGVVARYARAGGRGGFIHIIEAASAEQLGALCLKFVDLVEFEIVPVFELAGGKGLEMVEEYFIEPIPMHGPFKLASE